MSKSKTPTTTPSLSNKLHHLNHNQRLSLVSIAIITLSLSLAYWSTQQIRAGNNSHYLPTPPSAHQIQLSADLPPATINQDYQAVIMASSSNPDSQLHLTMTQLPAGIRAECNDTTLSPQVSCTIFGTPTTSGSHQVLITTIDRSTHSQSQQWLPLSIKPTTMQAAFRDYFSI